MMMQCICCGALVPRAQFCCQCGAPQSRITLSELHENWKKIHYRRIGNKGIERYETAWRELSILANRPASSITLEEYQFVMDSIAEKSYSKQQKLRQLISQLAQYAEICRLDVVNYAPFLILDGYRSKGRLIFSDEEIKRLFFYSQTAQGSYWEDAQIVMVLMLRLESMKRQGQRTDLTSAQIEPKLNSNRSNEQLAAEAGESRAQIQRYIRLTHLVPALLDMVDNGKPGFAAAVDLSFLGQDEQTALLEVMERERIKAPNGAQAKALRKASADRASGLTAEDILQVLRPVPSPTPPKSKTISVSRDELTGYMPATITTDAEALAYIKQALAYWKETHQGGCHDI